jgi:hypothetical protein
MWLYSVTVLRHHAGPVLCERDEVAQSEMDSVWLHDLSVLCDTMSVVLV